MQVSLLYDNLQAKQERIRQRELREVQQVCGLDSSCSSGGSGAVTRCAVVDGSNGAPTGEQAAQSRGTHQHDAGGVARTASQVQVRVSDAVRAISPFCYSWSIPRIFCCWIGGVLTALRVLDTVINAV